MNQIRRSHFPIVFFYLNNERCLSTLKKLSFLNFEELGTKKLKFSIRRCVSVHLFIYSTKVNIIEIKFVSIVKSSKFFNVTEFFQESFSPTINNFSFRVQDCSRLFNYQRIYKIS